MSAWMNAVCDLLIALAFFTIPVAFLLIVLRRTDRSFRVISLFLLAAFWGIGLLHLLSLLVIWQPVLMSLKIVTAVCWVVVAIAVWHKIKTFSDLLPALPTADMIDETEQRVAERATEIARTNQKLLVALKKQAKTSELRAAELARSNQELEQFAYIASHDLQEPLRAAALHLGLLAERYSHLFDDRAEQHIFYAVDGAKRMQSLIKDVQAFSRVRDDLQAKVLTDLNLVVEDVLRDLEAIIQSTKAVITLDLLPSMMCFPKMMKQLFHNLISNAIKFRSDSPPHISITFTRVEKDAQFCVEDNGIGIDLKHFDRIFLIFQRLHTREKYSGTGLGLAICKKVMTYHNGRIWVESTPGNGSKFFFQLPMEDV